MGSQTFLNNAVPANLRAAATMKSHRGLTIVIKLGTSSIVDEKTHEPLLSNLSNIVETSVKLRHEGHRVVIVSSGAIGVGLKRMNMAERPKLLPVVQALAAIGQCGLMATWDKLFGMLDQPVAQILLTRNDISDRTQYLNAKNTFTELLKLGVIPIVNENDTLSVSEIKFGDNDTLSAITAGMVHADYLFLMTDVDCLYDKNPRQHKDAQPIEVVDDISALVADVSSAGSSVGTGGMATKITAARLATSAGVTTVITRSSKPGNITEVVKYLQAQKAAKAADGDSQKILTPPLHTRFTPDPNPIHDRRFWLLYGLASHGTIYIDEGAYSALKNKSGLLPVGVKRVEGTFGQQEAVKLVVIKRLITTTTPSTAAIISDSQRPSPPGTPEREIFTDIGRALVNYSSAELQRIQGLHSLEIQKVLGYADSEYVALRENVSLFKERRPESPGLRLPKINNASGTTLVGSVSGSNSPFGPSTPISSDVRKRLGELKLNEEGAVAQDGAADTQQMQPVPTQAVEAAAVEQPKVIAPAEQ